MSVLTPKVGQKIVIECHGVDIVFLPGKITSISTDGLTFMAKRTDVPGVKFKFSVYGLDSRSNGGNAYAVLPLDTKETHDAMIDRAMRMCTVHPQLQETMLAIRNLLYATKDAGMTEQVDNHCRTILKDLKRRYGI